MKDGESMKRSPLESEKTTPLFHLPGEDLPILFLETSSCASW